MSNGPLHSVSVAGVTFDNLGRVLLIKRRDNGEWQAPGGILDVNETFEHGVAREVYEESGVIVEVGPLTGVYKNVVLGVVAIVYRCHAVGGAPTVSLESSDVSWVKMDDALALVLPVFAIRILDAARVVEQGVASRSHDGIVVL